jgi:hypothetical protein
VLWAKEWPRGGGGRFLAEDPQPPNFTCEDHISWTWHGSSNPDIFSPSFLDIVWASLLQYVPTVIFEESSCIGL